MEDRQKGRMIHKLIHAHSGQHYNYSKSKWERKPFFTPAEVHEAFGLTKAEGEWFEAQYIVDAPQSGWSLDDREIKIILRLAKRRKLTPQQVFSIRNQTTRKDAMEAYGLERLVKDGGGTMVQQDDFGILWRLSFRDGQDTFAMFVEVVNTTPEPDGHHAHYFLRVPPRTTTAREGVAWIGGFNPAETINFAGFVAQS